jgi:hypothetical protein
VQDLFHNIPALGFVEAWPGALFTFHLHYDFPEYSEMAVSLALPIKVEILIYVNSPYKSASILVCALAFSIAVMGLDRASEFLYFQF